MNPRIELQRDQALYPDVAWSKPEQKRLAGKLLIIGGHSHGFDAVARVFTAAHDAGIGEVKAAMPDSLRSLLGNQLPGTVYAASNNSGGLAVRALGELEAFAAWSQAVVLTQLGTNSETALLISQWLKGYDGWLGLDDDILGLLSPADLKLLLKRPQTLWTLTVAATQKLFLACGFSHGIRQDMGARPLALALQNEIPDTLMAVVIDDSVVISTPDDGGGASITPRQKHPDTAALLSWLMTWLIQQPERPYRTLTASVYDF